MRRAGFSFFEENLYKPLLLPYLRGWGMGKVSMVVVYYSSPLINTLIREN
jgi:hypothetical protein